MSRTPQVAALRKSRMGGYYLGENTRPQARAWVSSALRASSSRSAADEVDAAGDDNADGAHEADAFGIDLRNESASAAAAAGQDEGTTRTALRHETRPRWFEDFYVIAASSDCCVAESCRVNAYRQRLGVFPRQESSWKHVRRSSASTPPACFTQFA